MCREPDQPDVADGWHGGSTGGKPATAVPKRHMAMALTFDKGGRSDGPGRRIHDAGCRDGVV